MSRPTSYFWWKMSAAKWKLGKSPSGDALRKGDFSLRQERGPARLLAFKSAGFPRLRWEWVSDTFPVGMRGSEVHDQDKQLSC